MTLHDHIVDKLDMRYNVKYRVRLYGIEYNVISWK